MKSTGTPASKPERANFVWMDLEMTGLDPEKEGILEIATIITDSQLNILAEGPDLVVHQKPKLLDAMDEWNRKHHDRSGLADLSRNSRISVRDAEEATLDFIRQYCRMKASPLCGNSVHHDRRFLIKYMPKIHEYLHYRLVDVTTVKTLAQSWYPRARGLPKKGENHRALADIRESIEELKMLRANYFVLPEPPAKGG